MTISTFKDILRTGAWVNVARIRLWSWALLIGFAVALVTLFATAHGLNDYAGRPLGTDFSCLYTAGRLAVAGHASTAYDYVRENAELTVIFGRDVPFYGWFYPPFFLIPAQGLAHLPYLSALLVWQGLTFALYLLSLRLLISAYPVLRQRRLWLLLAVAFPAVFVNLTHGQTGFLTAALLIGALACLEKRPLLAGVLFGLLACKPQLLLAVPFALLGEGRIRPILAAICTVFVLCLVATGAYGMEIWQAYFAATRFGREVVLEQGAPGFEKMQSLFAFVRHVGGGRDLAYLAQAGVDLWVAFTLIRLWRSKADNAGKGAALALACLLITPYAMDYDMVLLAPAVVLMTASGLSRGFGDYEKTILAILWFSPMIARLVAGATCFPLGLAAMAMAYVCALKQARHS